MANVFTYKAAKSKYRCGNDYTNLTVLLFYGPASPAVPLVCAYCCNMNIDSDGDPQSYGPLKTPGIQPLDSLEDAGWAPPIHAGADFKHRGNQQRKDAYDAGIAAARAEYQDLQKQLEALDSKTIEQKTKNLDQKIGDAGKALDDLKQQKALPQKISEAEKALDDLKQQKTALDPQKVAKERIDLEENKLPAAHSTIYGLNPYEFKPLPKGKKTIQQQLWQPTDSDKPFHLGKIFFHWFGLQAMTPAQVKKTPADPRTKKTPVIYHPDFMKDPGPIQYQAYEDIYGKFPVVQQGDEPGPGYFVSTLATTVNSSFPEWDQRSTVAPGAKDVQPYGAVGKQLYDEAKVFKRDTVLAISCDSGASLAFPLLDWGNSDAVAECSWTAFTALGGTFGKFPGGQLFKTSEPVFLYLAFPNQQPPATVLSRIGTLDNADEFTTILAFLMQATFNRTSQPLQDYEFRKKHPEQYQNATISNLATAIYTNLLPNGFSL